MRSASGMVRKTKRAIGIAGLILIGLGAAMTSPIALSQESQRTAAQPKIANPASLEGEQAESVYQAIRESLRRNYANSGEPEAVAYQSWKRFNAVPYRSPNHGERFVNHYGNDKASEYGKYEDLQPMPQGAIVIKDSFLVTRQGVLKTGPLFVMEKMGPGFVSAAGYWRFWMLRPDDSMLGITQGADARNVQFCAECHKKAGAKHDYLYFMPPGRRLRR